jgi:Coenzyme PQQ synthesis protein D (PqqD)
MISGTSSEARVSLDGVYVPSEDIVARNIEGELIIVPLVSGIGDLEDELYSMNETGKAIWDRLNGKKKLKEVLAELSAEFDAPPGEIEKDLLGLVDELVRRKILVEVV